MKQYKVVIYQESALSSMLLNAAKVDPPCVLPNFSTAMPNRAGAW